MGRLGAVSFFFPLMTCFTYEKTTSKASTTNDFPLMKLLFLGKKRANVSRLIEKK